MLVSPIGILDPNRTRLLPSVEHTDNRCNCAIRKVYMIQCKHKVVAYKKFIPEVFKPCHHFRTTTVISYYRKLPRDESAYVDKLFRSCHLMLTLYHVRFVYCTITPIVLMLNGR